MKIYNENVFLHAMTSSSLRHKTRKWLYWKYILGVFVSIIIRYALLHIFLLQTAKFPFKADCEKDGQAASDLHCQFLSQPLGSTYIYLGSIYICMLMFPTPF